MSAFNGTLRLCDDGDGHCWRLVDIVWERGRNTTRQAWDGVNSLVGSSSAQRSTSTALWEMEVLGGIMRAES